MDEGRYLRRQLIGSILVAILIAAIAIAAVTLKFGSTPVAELEAKEEAAKQREDIREERLKQQEDSREERLEAAEGD